MKRVLQISNKRKENPIEKCAKDLNKNFSYIAGANSTLGYSLAVSQTDYKSVHKLFQHYIRTQQKCTHTCQINCIFCFSHGLHPAFLVPNLGNSKSLVSQIQVYANKSLTFKAIN